MQLADLAHDDRLALVALAEAVIMADGGVSDAETEGITKLTDAIGEETYRALLDEADEKFGDVEALKTYLKKVTSRESRELIYSTAYEELLGSPSVTHSQSALLQWLAEIWNIQVEDLSQE